jgi:hypothetical protein
MWLRDFLADDLRNGDYDTRILTYGYDSTLVGSASDASIHEFARRLLEALKDSRRRTDVSVGLVLDGCVQMLITPARKFIGPSFSSHTASEASSLSMYVQYICPT